MNFDELFTTRPNFRKLSRGIGFSASLKTLRLENGPSLQALRAEIVVDGSPRVFRFGRFPEFRSSVVQVHISAG